MRSISRILLSVGLVVTAACSGEAVAPDLHTQVEPLTTDTPYPVTPSDEAEARDKATIAETMDWSADEVDRQLAKSAALREITKELNGREDIFVGSAVGRNPADPPTVYIKGEADQAVVNLVATSPVAVEIVDNQPFSRKELLVRKEQLVQELRDLGYENTAVVYDIKQAGKLIATAMRETSAPTSVMEVLARVSADLRSDVELSLVTDPLDVPHASYGSLRVYETSVGEEATSAFTVVQMFTGTRGVVTLRDPLIAEPDFPRWRSLRV